MIPRWSSDGSFEQGYQVGFCLFGEFTLNILHMLIRLSFFPTRNLGVW